MITGYNTDVRHQEVVFHVQTEDKGAANPFIESLVYVGGQVLASKRANYADLLAEGRDEKEIIALMDQQHRTMIAAIRQGRFDAKLAALGRPKTSPMPVIEQVPAAGAYLPPAVGVAGGGPPRTAGRRPPAGASGPRPVGVAGAPTPVTAASAASAAGAANRAPTPHGVAVQPPPGERTLDQVILEYLTNEADQEQLVLVLESEADLGLGRRASLALRTSSSKSGLPIAGAQVSVRMISTIAEPRVLAVGRTDEQGGVPLRFEIPKLDRGTAALIISAVTAI